MVNGSRYYRALESISTASALSSALTIYPCQIRVHQTLTVLNSNFLQFGRRSGGRPQQAVYPRRLPVNTVIHTTLAVPVGLLIMNEDSCNQCCETELPDTSQWWYRQTLLQHRPLLHQPASLSTPSPAAAGHWHSALSPADQSVWRSADISCRYTHTLTLLLNNVNTLYHFSPLSAQYFYSFASLFQRAAEQSLQLVSSHSVPEQHCCLLSNITAASYHFIWVLLKLWCWTWQPFTNCTSLKTFSLKSSSAYSALRASVIMR